LKVLRISSRDTYSLRQKLLRPSGTLEDCIFEGDDDEQTFHLGAFIGGKLVSVSSFYFEKHQNIDAKFQYRLRGMATHPDYQKKGFSSSLLKTGFPIVKQNLCSIVWCNARSPVVGFYEKLGFKIIGNRFEIPEIGPHFLMVKDLMET
jgi:GNAT superfamily N-acetyltransferase